MAWCQRCKYEYEDHIVNCAECGDQLVSNLLETNEKIHNENGKYSVLINVANLIEADTIISLLEANSIPSFKGYQSSGSYLNITAGFNYQGTDIFVPTELLDEARSIISEFETENLHEDDNEEFKELKALERKFNDKRRNTFRLIIFILLIIPILMGLFYNLQEWI